MCPDQGILYFYHSRFVPVLMDHYDMASNSFEQEKLRDIEVSILRLGGRQFLC